MSARSRRHAGDGVWGQAFDGVRSLTPASAHGLRSASKTEAGIIALG